MENAARRRVALAFYIFRTDSFFKNRPCLDGFSCNKSWFVDDSINKDLPAILMGARAGAGGRARPDS